MYADVITDSMKRAIDETNRRREIQNDYNVKHNIIPQTITHEVENTLEITKKGDAPMNIEQLTKQIESVTSRMKLAANQLDFEKAIVLREELGKLNKQLDRLCKKKK